jgi:hypothetical protein
MVNELSSTISTVAAAFEEPLEHARRAREELRLQRLLNPRASETARR